MIIGSQGNPLIVQRKGVPAKSGTRNGGWVRQVVISLYPIRTIVSLQSQLCLHTARFGFEVYIVVLIVH